MKRRVAATAAGFIFPALPSASQLFVHFPLVCTHVTLTEYEDHTPRKPGDLLWKNRGGSFELTAYDPDSGSKLPAVGATIDDTWAALEMLLGTPDAPWVPDRYLMEQLAKATPKKKG